MGTAIHVELPVRIPDMLLRRLVMHPQQVRNLLVTLAALIAGAGTAFQVATVKATVLHGFISSRSLR